MAKPSFLNQKLGKRKSHLTRMLKAQLSARQSLTAQVLRDLRLPKKGSSRLPKPSAPDSV